MKVTYIFGLLLYIFASGEEISLQKGLHDLISVYSNSTNKQLMKLFQNPKLLLSVMESADPNKINEIIVFIDSIIEQSLNEKADIISCRNEKQAFVDAAVKKRTKDTEEHTIIQAELVEAIEKVLLLEQKEDDKRTLENSKKLELKFAKKEVETCKDEVDKVIVEFNEEHVIYQKIIDLLLECAASNNEFDFIAGPKVDNGLWKPCSDPYDSLELAESACLAEESCSWLHNKKCDNKKWRWCSSSVKRTRGDKKACSILKSSKKSSLMEQSGFLILSGKEASSHKVLHDLISVHSNSTNKHLMKLFQNPKVLLSVMESADPNKINEVIAFTDSIIEQSRNEKADIIACRNEKQAFVNAAVKNRTKDTEEHTKIQAELVEAIEKVMLLEQKEDDKRTLENSKKLELKFAKKEVETCKDEVDKVIVEFNEEIPIYLNIIDLLLEYAVSNNEFDFIAGPKVDNGLWKSCSDPYDSLELAESACLTEKSCSWLHNGKCDNKKWRWCSSSVKITRGDKKACSILKSKVTGKKTSTGGKDPLQPQPHLKPSTDVNFESGPKVANKQYKKCSKAYKTLKLAKSACLADKFCSWLHNYNCDNKKWRWCSSTVQKTPGDKKACSLLKSTGGKDPVPPTNSSTSGKDLVIVPSPLTTSFESKWKLDDLEGFSAINTGFMIPSDGSITQWEYFAGSSSGVYLQVYRSIKWYTYKLLGQNFVSASVKDKINKVKITLKNRINVKKGDYIGWTFVGKAAFGFSTSQGTTNWAEKSGFAFKTVGGEFEFPNSGKRLYECRAYLSS